MTISGSFGEQPLTEQNMLEQLNRIWLPLLKKMLAAQNKAVTVSTDAPTTPSEGDFWFDTGGPQLYIFSSGLWVAV